MIFSNKQLKEKSERKLRNAELALAKGLDVLYRKQMVAILAIDAEIKRREEWGIYAQFDF